MTRSPARSRRAQAPVWSSAAHRWDVRLPRAGPPRLFPSRRSGAALWTPQPSALGALVRSLYRGLGPPVTWMTTATTTSRRGSRVQSVVDGSALTGDTAARRASLGRQSSCSATVWGCWPGRPQETLATAPANAAPMSSRPASHPAGRRGLSLGPAQATSSSRQCSRAPCSPASRTTRSCCTRATRSRTRPPIGTPEATRTIRYRRWRSSSGCRPSTEVPATLSGKAP